MGSPPAATGCECGEPDAADCRAAFEAALAVEFGHPEYFEVHHLTVAAYQVQHPSTHPAPEAYDVLRRFLDEGVAPRQMRRDLAANRVPSGEGRVPAPSAGARRLTGVRLENPATYRADIEQYARSVLEAARRGPRTTRTDR